MSPLSLHNFMFRFEHVVALKGNVCAKLVKTRKTARSRVSVVQRNSTESLLQTTKSLLLIIHV